MSRLNELIARCQCGVHLDINEHADHYQCMWQYLDEMADEIDDERHIEIRRRRYRDNYGNLVRLQFYPDTPIGSYTVWHWDVDQAIEEAIKILDDLKSAHSHQEYMESLNVRDNLEDMVKDLRAACNQKQEIINADTHIRKDDTDRIAELTALYEEVRSLIDDGNEAMTHADAVKELTGMREENERLRNAIKGLLSWCEEIAGDNQDKNAAAHEIATTQQAIDAAMEGDAMRRMLRNEMK